MNSSIINKARILYRSGKLIKDIAEQLGVETNDIISELLNRSDIEDHKERLLNLETEKIKLMSKKDSNLELYVEEMALRILNCDIREPLDGQEKIDGKIYDIVSVEQTIHTGNQDIRSSKFMVLADSNGQISYLLSAKLNNGRTITSPVIN